MRRSSPDISRLQKIHDAAVALGAECSHSPRHRHVPGLGKANPHWADELRVSAGNPDGGEWTGDGGQGGQSAGENVELAAAPGDDTAARKERFVDAHLEQTRAVAKELGVPVENILGVAALESKWGESRFAADGNNYFGMHYPAPFATGFVYSTENKTKVATFASYADSLRSFALTSGSIMRSKSNPEAFATALQDSGKFGIDTKTGAKVPGYVDGVAATIRGLRPFVARRQT
jgi:hypothetical protein